MPGFACSHLRQLAGCGHYHQAAGRQPGGNRLPAGHEKVELVTGGRGWVPMPGGLAEVTAGALIWHLPGERMISRSDDDDPYSCLSITWAVSRAQPRQVPRLTRWREPAEAAAYTSQVVAAWSDGRVDRRLLATASYLHLLWHAHLDAATTTGPEVPAALRRVLAAVEGDPARDWSVGAMADAAGWSPSRLHAAFRSHLRTSPHQHLLEQRLRTARELLVTTGDDLAAVASRAGLGSAAALCRHFRRSTGITPGAFRARQR